MQPYTDTDTLKWDLRQRLKLLECTLLLTGWVRTQALTESFGISRAQASKDFAVYQSLAPDNLVYDRSRKRYQAGEAFRPVLLSGRTSEMLDLLAALAPCVMGYGEIGARLERTATSENYADWIATYASEDYQQVCRDVGALIDTAMIRRLGTTPQDSPRWTALTQRFTTATRLEVGFWDMGLEAV